MFEKYPWKSDILSKYALSQVFYKHFASKNQLHGLSVSGKLAENGLRSFFRKKYGLSCFVLHLANCS